MFSHQISFAMNLFQTYFQHQSFKFNLIKHYSLNPRISIYINFLQDSKNFIFWTRTTCKHIKKLKSKKKKQKKNNGALKIKHARKHPARAGVHRRSWYQSTFFCFVFFNKILWFFSNFCDLLSDFFVFLQKNCFLSNLDFW